MKLSALILLLLSAVHALANDGWVGYSGAPRIEGKHPTVRMVDEVIHIKIGRTHMTADCRFTFKNEGNATSVRIGFPDHDSDNYLDPKKGIQSIYNSFKSYVDGKPIRTKLIDASEDFGWQVKSVQFGKGQVRRVRNVYVLELNNLSLGGKWSSNQSPRGQGARYIVSTGRSWKGNIGSTKVIVDFEKSSLVKSPLRVQKLIDDELASDASRWDKNRGLVMWSGFAAPKVQGRRLIFERKNWEPKESDDLFLKFGIYPRPKSWDK